MTLTFTSDGSITFSGWSAVFSSVTSSYVASPSPGAQAAACTSAGASYQTDSGVVDFSTGYSNSLSCSYVFAATTGMAAQVSFQGAFYTEAGFDFVRLYNGTSDAFATLSGRLDPLPGTA